MRHLTAAAAETEQIGAVAAQALSDIHSALYGQPPRASRAWIEGDAILLVMRLPVDGAARRGDPPLGAIQKMVSATVQRRTGVSLRTAGSNADTDRGLGVLAFERLRAGTDALEEDAELPAGPVLGSG